MSRVIKSTSFSKKDKYEVDLYDFAMSQCNYFGRYVKRLIADHKAHVEQGLTAEPSKPIAQIVYEDIEATQVIGGNLGIPEDVEPYPIEHDLSEDINNFI